MPENKHSSGQFAGGGGEEEAKGKKNNNKMMWGRDVNPGRKPGALLPPVTSSRFCLRNNHFHVREGRNKLSKLLRF